MEDFTDSDQFILFSEDYLKLKHFLLEGASLLIKATISERKFKNGQLDTRINNIMLLNEALERNTKGISLKLNLSAVTEYFITEVDTLIKQCPGSCMLKFIISDPEEKTEITMPGPKNKVNPVTFLKKAIELQDVDYRLE